MTDSEVLIGPITRRRAIALGGVATATVVAGGVALHLSESQPDTGEYDIGKLYTLPAVPPPGVHFEVAPWIVPENKTMTVTTANTIIGELPGSLREVKQVIPQEYATKDFVNFGNEAVGPWGRNWNGIFTEHVVNNSDGSLLVGLQSGENKNEQRYGQIFQNTVDKTLRANQKASGYDEHGVYTDDWDSYNAFVNMSWKKMALLIVVPKKGRSCGQ